MSVAPVATVVNGNTYTLDPRYDLSESKILGKGSFGVVCTAYDTVRKMSIAIKRIRPYANDEWDAKHTLREVRLMRLLGQHPNVSIFAHSTCDESVATTDSPTHFRRS
jgi:serine/threonine protein kinase